MTSITPFNFESAPVRVVTVSGEPWFVARDVAQVLGYTDTDQAIRKHCKAAKTSPVESTGQVRQMKIIPERDVYRLVMNSRLPAAERFEEWVVGEVLPTIRKTGTYTAQPAVPQTFAEALRLAADLAEQNLQLAQQVAEQAPVVAGFQRIADADGSVTARDAAKSLQVAPSLLIKWLIGNRRLYRSGKRGSLLAFQPRIDAGLLVHKVTTIPLDTDDGGTIDKLVSQPRITPKGLAKLADHFCRKEACA